MSDLVGELSMRSEPFRKWWAAHDVRYHQTGRKRLHHPVVGDMELEYEVMEIAADSGLRLQSSAPSRVADPPRRLTFWRAGRRPSTQQSEPTPNAPRPTRKLAPSQGNGAI